MVGTSQHKPFSQLATEKLTMSIQNAPGFATNGKTKSKGFTPAAKSDRPAPQMTTADLCKKLDVSVEQFEQHCREWSIVIDEEYSPAQVAAMLDIFEKSASAAEPSADRPDSNRAVGAYKIDTARENSLALSGQSHQAMNALQSAGLQNAAQYVARKQQERNAIVDRVSDAIAYLSDPDLLESDIMSAAAAKVAARSDGWGYAEPVIDFDNLFALPESSQRLLGGA
jgi:hypothetical protein